MQTLVQEFPYDEYYLQRIEITNRWQDNLFCYSPEGIVLWKAEHPTGDNAEDYYYRISSHLPLVVNSFSSYRCEIDLSTGKIIRKDFFK